MPTSERRMMVDFTDVYVCNDCGEEFVDDGSMMCPHCEGGDLMEAEEWYKKQAEWESQFEKRKNDRP